MGSDGRELQLDPECIAELDKLRSKAAQIREKLRVAPRAREASLIFQGGGALGMAHAGALLGLEAIGLQPRSVAGTSAGAIVATLVAAHRASRPAESTASFILDALTKMPSRRFLDGSAANQALLSLAVKWPRGMELLRAVLGGLAAARRMFSGRPLYLGGAFSSWLDAQLRGLGFDDLFSLVAATHDRLKVCATAMPHGLKFVFPDHLPVVDIPTRMLRPSFMARCSMSIPFVFRPIDVPLAPVHWRALCEAQLSGSRPGREIDAIAEARRIRLVDGGILSNVPLDVLPKAAGEDYPTIVVRLYSSHRARSNRESFVALNRPVSMIASMFSSARGIRDLEVGSQAHANRCVASVFIDTGRENWLDFSQNPGVMRRLVLSGIKAVGEQV